MLIIESARVSIGDSVVLENISISLFEGSCTLIQGANGSGKSSFLNALAGHPFYSLTAQRCEYRGKSLLDMSVVERAQAGVFLISQNSCAIPGLTFSLFLYESFKALHPHTMQEEYAERLSYAMDFLQLPSDFLDRGLHEQFSGGEKKRCELLQMMVLQPTFVLLDEVDSGLDAVGVNLFVRCVQWFRQAVPASIILVVTHSRAVGECLMPTISYQVSEGTIHVSS